VEPVGAPQITEVDVRVLAATNRKLEEEMAEGRFREDLFYRLNVIPIQAPPLREHLEDIPELVDYFVRRYTAINNCRPKEFSAKAVTFLQELPWKGNVRELKNVIERVLILSSESEITDKELVQIIGGQRRDLTSIVATAQTLKEFREAAERLFLVGQLERHEWNVTRTAQSIRTPRSNLCKKMEHYGIRRRVAADES
jgi:two-component system nitrogen regulation response regulator NtrX